ncbi:MAG: DUF6259 domain-containing protein [Planctomycetota bacterium]
MRSLCLQLILITSVCLAVCVPCWSDEARAIGGKEELVLENAYHRLEVDNRHGRLLRLLDKVGKIDLKSPVELAENFRLHVAIPDDPNNFVFGKDQNLSRSEASEYVLVLHWDGPMKDQHGGIHNLAATMRIKLEGESVVFRFSLANKTKYKVQEVWYPAIGGLLGFGPPDLCGQATLNPPPHHAKQLRQPFGYHLAGYPTQNMGFVEVNNPAIDRSMYLGAHDRIARFKCFYFYEFAHGDKSNVAAYMIHYPFTQPDQTFKGSSLVVQFHKGDWIAGGKEIYRPWFIKTFGLMRPDRDWIRQQCFFQYLMIMLPEGNINYTIREIPQLARDGLKYGVKALHISGWQRGGHDNGYPYYEPDPRLGTWDDLENAIQQCHDMGAKIYFFVNIHVNNMDTEWYKAELKDYNYEVIKGFASWVDGWGMGTLASRMSHTVPLMSFADVSFPKLADAHLNYFKKLAQIGADGIHIDKVYPQAINFNPRIVMSPDQSPWEGTIRLVDRIDRECRAINPGFRISFETTWDRVLQYGNATWWAGNLSVARRIFPELVETVRLNQPYNYIGVNDATRYGHVVMIGPSHFNKSMDYEPWRGLSSYIREVKKIRDDLADYVFLGEVLDTGEVELQNPEQSQGIEHAVYRNLKNHKRACIVTNRGALTAHLLFAGFGPERKGKVRVYCPYQDPVTLELPAQIKVDPERVVFVVEN